MIVQIVGAFRLVFPSVCLNAKECPARTGWLTISAAAAAVRSGDLSVWNSAADSEVEGLPWGFHNCAKWNRYWRRFRQQPAPNETPHSRGSVGLKGSNSVPNLAVNLLPNESWIVEATQTLPHLIIHSSTLCRRDWIAAAVACCITLGLYKAQSPSSYYRDPLESLSDHNIHIVAVKWQPGTLTMTVLVLAKQLDCLNNTAPSGFGIILMVMKQ